MCGLTFLYSMDAPKEQLRTQTAAALDRISHRGPDDEGIEIEGQAAMGHRRLSIIDLKASHQPMQAEHATTWLCYNGEIYNYARLRETLRQQWDFKSSGDTEVLLAGLLAKGESFLCQAEGMWAFALWNSDSEQLLLGRDRLGKKPLYYAVIPRGLAVASELPALMELCEHRWEEDLDSTADYFRYGYQLPGFTAFKGVHEVLPGHTLRWSPRDGIHQQSYWTLPLGRFSGSRNEAGEKLEELMVESVRRRMVSDVEVGAFLSGGIDSSLIVNLAQAQSEHRLKTFTVGFTDKSYDETSYARLVAADNHTEHHEEILDLPDLDALEQTVLRYASQPFGDPSYLPTELVSRLAARHVKVVLSGDGADELFSGYQRYQARLIMRWYTRAPGAIRHTLEQLLALCPEPNKHHSRSLLKKAHLFVDATKRSNEMTEYVAGQMFSPDRYRALFPNLAALGHAAPRLADDCHLDDVHEMMAKDLMVYLPQDILQKVDRATMANSLESRAPFLDSDLVAFALSIPFHWHRRGLVGKRLLRETFKERLPRQILKRRKQGFSVPLGNWFAGELGTRLASKLENTEIPIDKTAASALLHSHRNGERDFGFQLWAMYVYLLWSGSHQTPRY